MLTGSQTYRLTKLLRGRLGTEHAIRSPLALGAPVVLLNEAVAKIDGKPAERLAARFYRWGPQALDIADPAWQQTTFATKAVGRMPWSPVQIAGARNGGGDLTITWVRRTRFGGVARMFADEHRPWPVSTITRHRRDLRHGLRPEQPGLALAIMISGDLVQHTDTLGIEIAEDAGLHIVGNDTEQDGTVQMLWCRLANQFSPSHPEPVKVETGESSDFGCKRVTIGRAGVRCGRKGHAHASHPPISPAIRYRVADPA